MNLSLDIPRLETLELSSEAQVLSICLNRPEKYNALNTQMLQDIATAVEWAQGQEALRVIVLRGTGKAFCAGADLTSGVMEDDISLKAALDAYYHPAIRAIYYSQKPVIAAVNGPAAGAGLSLALSADMRVISSAAFMDTAFVRIGLTLDAGGSFFLPRLVGRSRALELSYSGRRVPAEEAVRLGLAEQMMAAENFEKAVQAYAAQLAQGAPLAYSYIKKSIDRSFENGLEEHLELESVLQDSAGRSQDFKEGVRAFAEKRPPKFQGA